MVLITFMLQALQLSTLSLVGLARSLSLNISYKRKANTLPRVTMA